MIILVDFLSSEIGLLTFTTPVIALASAIATAIKQIAPITIISMPAIATNGAAIAADATSSDVAPSGYLPAEVISASPEMINPIATARYAAVHRKSSTLAAIR